MVPPVINPCRRCGQHHVPHKACPGQKAVPPPLFVRPTITQAEADKAVQLAYRALQKHMEQKGTGAFISPHEMLGQVEEEAFEFKLGVQSNSYLDQKNELLDIAVAAIWSIASLKRLYLQ